MAKNEIYTYEGLFLFGTAATVDTEGSVRSIGELVQKHGGEVLHLRKWDERKLAFEVKKNKRGLYVLCFFKAPGTAVDKITRDVNLSETILRVLITDAGHLNVDEMKAMEPQQPAKELPPTGGTGFGGGGFGGGGFGGGGGYGGRRGFDEPVPAEATGF